MTSTTAAVAAVGVGIAVCGIIGIIAAMKGIHLTPRRTTASKRTLTREHMVIIGAMVMVLVITRLPIMALSVGAIAWFVPTLWSDQGTSARLNKLRGLASWARVVADRLSSGAAVTLEQAIAQACQEPPDAIAGPAKKLGARVSSQASAWGTENALRAFADDLDDHHCDRVVGALILRHRSGGKGLKGVMASLVESVDRTVSREDELLSDNNSARNDARIIASLVLVMIIVMMIMQGSPMQTYATPTGQLYLLPPAALIMLGLWRMKVLSRPETPPRILTPQEDAS